MFLKLINIVKKNFMKKRIEWIDTVKYICIMFVMITHLESCTEFLRIFFEPFFLTLFFFCSGYVYKDKNNFKEFFWKKIKQLFIPWLFFSCFIIFTAQIFSFHDHANLLEELKWNFLQIREMGDGIWFIPALFVTYIPFYFYIKRYEKSQNKYKDIIFLVISFMLSFISILYTWLMNPKLLPWNSANLPWHLEYIFQGMLYMYIGYIFKNKCEAKLDLHNKRLNRILLLVIYIVIRYVVYFNRIHFPMIIDITYNYLSEILGGIMIISFAKVIKSNKYISFVGQNTLLYFAFHGKIFSLIQVILRKMTIYHTILNNTVYSSIFAIFFGIVLSFILIIPSYIVSRYFPFLLGRKKQPKTLE